jgi:FkbM family methyltransferase
MIRSIVEWLIDQPAFPGRTPILRRSLPLVPAVRSSSGVILRTNARDATNLFCICGTYGPAIPSAIASIPAGGGIFLDVGANCGLFSLLAARRLTEGMVVAFEPNPVTYQLLLENIRLNQARNVIPLNLALGDADDVFGLSFDATHSGLSHLTPARPARFTVPVLDVARFSWLERLAADKSVFVKIDVEGYELAVIAGLLRTAFASNIRMMIVEIDDANLSSFGHRSENLYGLLQEVGFEPRYGAGSSAHYDEVFTRPGG